jgi:hypothetical protein
MEAVKSRHNNLLTHPQTAKLYAWLEANRHLAAEKTAQVVAVIATETLGFGVTESNIGTARRALNITKPKTVAPATGCRCAELADIVLRLHFVAGLTVLPGDLDALKSIAATPHEKRFPVTIQGSNQRFELVETGTEPLPFSPHEAMQFGPR